MESESSSEHTLTFPRRETCWSAQSCADADTPARPPLKPTMPPRRNLAFCPVHAALPQLDHALVIARNELLNEAGDTRTRVSFGSNRTSWTGFGQMNRARKDLASPPGCGGTERRGRGWRPRWGNKLSECWLLSGAGRCLILFTPSYTPRSQLFLSVKRSRM